MATPSTVLITSGVKELGSPITLSTNRASTSYTHTINYSWAGRVGTIATDVGDSVVWTPSIVNMAPHLTNATSAICTLTCYTYEGSKLIGSRTSNFTLSIPASVTPTISSVAVSDVDGYDNKYGGFISGISTLNITINASGKYGSTITNYMSYAGSRPVGDTATGTSSPLTYQLPYQVSGDVTLYSSVTDSRGRSAVFETPITVFSYTNPSLQGTTFERWNTSTNQPDDESSTVRVKVVSTICDVGGKNLNRATVVVKYKLSTSSSWTTYTTRTNLGISSSFDVDIPNLSENNNYDIDVVCTDSFGREVSFNGGGVSTAKPVIDLKSNGNGIGFLTISDEDGISIGSDIYLAKGNGSSTYVYAKNQSGSNTSLAYLGYNSFYVYPLIESQTGFKTSGYLNVSGRSDFYGDVAFHSSVTFNDYLRVPAMTADTVAGTFEFTGSNREIGLSQTSYVSNSGVTNFRLYGNAIWCKYAGYVKVSFRIQIYGLAASQNAAVLVYKNGVAVDRTASITCSPNGAVCLVSSPTVIQVNAGDEISLYGRSTNGGGVINNGCITVSY